MSVINLVDINQMLKRQRMRPRPYKFKTMLQKISAEETGMMEHKGKTIPKEVKSLADRIRKKEPDRSDEYAYRTAWDIFRSHTTEGKRYPRKSEDSGLKREGGGTGPIEKKGMAMSFFDGFEKAAGISAGNLKAVAQSAKRMKPKKPAGTVDLGKWWEQPLNTGPKWKESLAKA